MASAAEDVAITLLPVNSNKKGGGGPQDYRDAVAGFCQKLLGHPARDELMSQVGAMNVACKLNDNGYWRA